MASFRDGFEVMPDPNTPMRVASAGVVHPIAVQVCDQISQDMIASIHPAGESGELYELSTPIQYLLAWVQEALYQSLIHGRSYLVLDYGGDPATWDEPVTNTPMPSGVRVDINPPRVTDHGATQNNLIHPSRYLVINSPYRYPLARVVTEELTRHDRITDGITNSIENPAIVAFRIQGLWERLKKGGNAIAQLTERLARVKSGVKSGGVIAYSNPEETMEILDRKYSREHESIAIIERRVAAITGLPNFLIWGTLDGDSYGVNSSLSLYEQRLVSLANRYLIPILNRLADQSTETIRFKTGAIFPEPRTENADRFAKVSAALGDLVQLRSITAIEARNTIASQFDLVLDQNPQTTTDPDNNA